ncbi:MAG: Hsp20/alpha crystallin family protein [Burkholderiaceae bacterium]
MSNPSAAEQDNVPTQTPSTRSSKVVLTPAIDVFENQDGITLLADMPGVSKDDLDIQIEAHMLTIQGDVTLDLLQGTKVSQIAGERSHYRRVFTLSKALDADQVSAQLNQGVLTLRIPKAAHAQPRKVVVQAG